MIAYGQPCFLHTNHTLNATRRTRNKRFLFALLFSAIVEASIGAKLEKYQALMNQRLGALANRMNDGFNRTEGQIDGIHRGQLQLQHEITVLARFTEELADRESTFETTQINIDRQLIEGEISLSRATIENRQLALAAGKATAQQAILDYHLHKRIIALLEHLPVINEIQNNTIYRNKLRKGIIECEELYWYGTNLSHFIAKYQDTEAIEQVEQIITNAPVLRNELAEAEANAQRTLAGREELEEIENATVPDFEMIHFTIHWDPVTLPLNNSWAGGAGQVLSSVLDFGGKVVDDVSGVFNNVVDKGADVIEHTEDTVSGFFSGPIKLIIIIVGTIIGIILVMVFGSCAWRYYKTGNVPNTDKALELATRIGNLNPVTIAGAMASQGITSKI